MPQLKQTFLGNYTTVADKDDFEALKGALNEIYTKHDLAIDDADLGGFMDEILAKLEEHIVDEDEECGGESYDTMARRYYQQEVGL